MEKSCMGTTPNQKGDPRRSWFQMLIPNFM